jgi:hypothetical protein
MFAFLSNLGRLGVTIAVLVAVAGILGFTTLGIQLVASHHNASATAACAVSMGSVIGGQQRLSVSAHGLSANTNYLEAQTGVQSVMVTTDAAGSVSDQSLMYHGAGSYNIKFDYFYWSNNKLVEATGTSCSANL